MITIDSAVPIHRLCVDVFGKGPRGGAINYTVHYDRRDRPEYGTCHKGPLLGYLPVHMIPEEVLAAANQVDR